ncbi:MAG TPA: YtxH domain-containing protein [Cyclobacteriaceae bacterium]|nr:YtxH domain-containing protein [Cyclobacteriaceae bacterium]HRJ82262.1 YtxH domain-containing protein [Cyclobacteriaceae bacterium]
MKTKNAMIGVVAGIATGAVLGGLYVSIRGTGTRKKVIRKGEDFANALNERIDQRFDELMKKLSGKALGIKEDSEFA